MRTSFLLSWALLIALVPAGCGVATPSKPPQVTGQATGGLAPGSRVGARREGELVLAEVVKLDGESYQVKWSTGATGKVPKSDILPVAATGTLKAGDRVLAPIEAVKLWQADVVRLEGSDAVVVFNGQTDEVKVPQDRVALLPPGLCDPGAGCTGSGARQKDTGGGAGTQVAAPTDPFLALRDSLKVGDKVIVQWAEFNSSNHYDWRVGTVSGRMGDALVIKVEGEAEPKNGFPRDLRPLRAPRRPIGQATTFLWPEKPGRYLEVWIPHGPDPEGNVMVYVKRGERDGSAPVTMKASDLTNLAPLAPEDF